jgi:uncharacterized membrane protein YfcA
MLRVNIFLLLTACLMLGAFAGFLAGLLGVGGGLVIVPILAVLYHLQGFDTDLVMQLAVGTSLATIVFTSLSSALAHHRRGSVHWRLVAQLSLGIALGGWLGGVLAVWLGGVLLALLFGVFELLIAAQMLSGRSPPIGHSAAGGPLNVFAGAVIGAISALLGIGGGTLTVPWLSWHNIDMRAAVGTSAACGFPIATVGAAGFVVSGWGEAGLPAGSSGFVYWPAVAGISVASVLSAPLGARLAHRIDQGLLRRVFALFLACLGVVLIGRALSV